MFYRVFQVFWSTGSIVKRWLSCSYLFFCRVNTEMFEKKRYQVRNGVLTGEEGRCPSSPRRL